MNRYLACALLLAAPLAVACNQDVDTGGESWDGSSLESFEPAPALQDLDLSQLRPASPVTYIELRRVFGARDFEVVSSTGDKCAEARDRDECLARFDEIYSDAGFNRGCLPASCHSYFVVNRGDEVFVVASDDELRRFFGDVDTPEEALILASAAGYHWSDEGDAVRGGYREVDGGYQVIGLRLTRTCAPIVTERALLFVSEDGEVRVQSSEIISYIRNACI